MSARILEAHFAHWVVPCLGEPHFMILSYNELLLSLEAVGTELPERTIKLLPLP